MTDERYALKDTIVVFEHREDRREKIRELSEKLSVKTYIADKYEDILAVPAFLCFINPDSLKMEEWRELVEGIKEMEDPDMKIYLLGKQYSPAIPAKFLVKVPEDAGEDFIKFLLLKTRSKIERKKRISDKALRRITRLMFLLRELEGGQPVRVSKIAEELEVGMRTIQRDIEILESAGYPLLQEKRGEFRIPKNFKAYDLFCRQH